jgi:hypothetical protein
VYKVPSVKHAPSETTWEVLKQEDPLYAGLAIHWRREAEKERFVYVVGGVAPEERTLCTNAADVMTTCAAILERMIYAKISGKLHRRQCRDYGHYNAVLGEFKNRVVKAVGRACRPVDPQEFVDSYTGRKRTIYQNNLSEYLNEGVKECHALLSTFMKVEKVPVGKSPRCIQPRHPVFNIGLGRYLKHMEKPIFRAMAKVWGQKYVVFKGLNAIGRGTGLRDLWNKLIDPVAVGIDASRFDASVDGGMLQWEHSLYLMLFGADKELARLLKMQLHNVGVSYCHDGKIKYHTAGGRGSGDMNTSLGNSLIMCAIVWAWLRECGVKAYLANDGDDCIVLMERESLPAFSEGFDAFAKNLGFTAVVEEAVDVFEEIEFCQSRPVCVDGEWRMVRNYNTAREKDSMCLFPLTQKGALRSWLYAVGECGLALTSGVPIVQELYLAYMRNGKTSRMSEAVFMQSGARMMSIGMESKSAPVEASTRVSFFKAFGVTPDEQTAMEEYYRSWRVEDVVELVEGIAGIGGAPM